ncbi:MAG: single-stranded-DNA-specific exonuclease RecJ [Bacteroidales bacterium]|nr:single-stranded-DNA-specific exonuclease RecJ [Bacteroidales bacterium]
MQKRWVVKEQGDKETVTHLSEVLNIDQNLSNLLVQRGISTFEEAKFFFRPELSSLYDPFLMKDMDKAVSRIEKAIANKEKILIFGDYDVDGTTAVALLYTFIKNIYDKVLFYIPDRYEEGYGISQKSIDFAYENNYTLIIALDCGIKAIEKVVYAAEKGIDYIICDHHRPGDKIPDAYAVLDPKREDCDYPYKELSGCGVGFKLVQAYAQKNNIPFDDLTQYLDLVVVSIASDIVPIDGENRILAYYGLKLINTDPRPGFEAILKYSRINRLEKPRGDNGFIFNRELTITDLVFLIGPRINAAGRIESGKNSVRLLICEKDNDYVVKLGEQINNFNLERRNLDTQITQEALDIIENDPNSKSRKSTVLYNPEWHKGVIGIVASRLTENYYRPTIVLTKSNGLITGSARSVKDFDIYDALDACRKYINDFGGHKYAAGLTIKPENFDAFCQLFEEVVASTITEEMLIPEIEIDAKINLNKINKKFYKILKQFAPFGPGNMSPVFQTDDLVDTGYSRIVGKNHLKLNIVHQQTRVLPFQGIAYQQGFILEKIKAVQGEPNKPFKVCYHLEENEWNGNVTLQLNVKGIQLIG